MMSRIRSGSRPFLKPENMILRFWALLSTNAWLAPAPLPTTITGTAFSRPVPWMQVAVALHTSPVSLLITTTDQVALAWGTSSPTARHKAMRRRPSGRCQTPGCNPKWSMALAYPTRASPVAHGALALTRGATPGL